MSMKSPKQPDIIKVRVDDQLDGEKNAAEAYGAPR